MKVFGHEVSGKTVAIVVGIGAVLAFLVSRSSSKASGNAGGTPDTNGLDQVTSDPNLGISGSAAGGGGGASGIDPNTLSALVSLEEAKLAAQTQQQQNALLAQIQAEQVAAAQTVQTLGIKAGENEAQTQANTQRTDTIITTIGGIAQAFLGRPRSGSSPSPSGAPSFGSPGYSGGVPGVPTYAFSTFPGSFQFDI